VPTILVCDDEEVLRALVRATLEPDGHEIVEARNGDEALELIGSLRPDLVVLDMMMPGRSGVDVLEQVRADDDPAVAGSRVIMLTARAQVTDRDRASEAGADHFLPKPFSPTELASLVDEVLGQDE
jgi:CheY-like chemotaxis protein